MFTSQKKHLHWLWVSILIIVVDQITKRWITQHFELGEISRVLPFFNLTYAQNPGAAFSFLSQSGNFALGFLLVFSILFTLFMLIWLYRLSNEKKLLSVSLVFIIGGAIGNIVDRLMHGYVVDFLDFHIQHWHWPAFNVADSAITVGAFLLALDCLKNR